MRCQLYGLKDGDGTAICFVLGPWTDSEWWFREMGSHDGGIAETTPIEIGEAFELDEPTTELAERNGVAFGELLREQGHPISTTYLFSRVTFAKRRPARRR